MFCPVCRFRDELGKHATSLASGEPPTCPECHERAALKEIAGQRGGSVGLLRPDIVLYNEPSRNGDFIAATLTKDLGSKPDMLLIIGTSLKVDGCKRLVKDAAKAVHARNGIVVFVNNTDINLKEWDGIIDFFLKGDADAILGKLWNKMNSLTPQGADYFSC